MGKLRPELRPPYGPERVGLGSRREGFALAAETVDMTLPVNRKPLGARRPMPEAPMEDVEDFFVSTRLADFNRPEIESR